nr:uncharacterized protein LOC104092895 [Nicotiana tomentosiformis]
MVPIESTPAAHSEGGRTIVPLLGSFRGGGKWILSSGGRRECTLQHVPRDQNSEGDAPATLVLSVDSDEFSSATIVQLMKSVIEEGHAEIPKNREPFVKATRFSLAEGALVTRTFDGPLARCLGPGETEYALREVHEGTCRKHSGAGSLVQKLIRAGYYWIEMEKYGKDFIWRCDDCQRYASMIHQLGEMLHSVLSP